MVTSHAHIQRAEVPIGIVLPSIESYRLLVHAIFGSPAVIETEFSYAAPLFRATPQLADQVRAARGALEKFDAYFDTCILDEEMRVKMAAAFRQRYLRANPRSEGSDVFLASGDVLQFRFEFAQPTQLDDVSYTLDVVELLPHDPVVLKALREGERIARGHLQGSLKLFLDHVANPRRRQDAEVREVMTGPRADDPIVLELMIDGALPGLFGHLLAPHVHAIDGALVMLQG
ncbi:MAG: hypothetical protein ACO3JL_17560 [Myxococcota bacterium]